MIKIAISDCCIQKDKYFCAARDYNLIFTVDKNEKKIELFATLPEYKAYDSCIGGIKAYGDFLIILTLNGNYNWIINQKTGEKICIYKGEEYYESQPGFTQAYKYNNLIYMIGAGYAAIICVNMDDYSVRYITAPYKECEIRGKNKNDAYFKHQGVVVDDKMYLASMRDNYVLEFNLKNEKYKWIKVGSEENRYSGIIYDEGVFWMAPRLNTGIVRWEKGGIEEIVLPDGFESKDAFFFGIGRCGKDIILPNMKEKRSIRIDSMTREKEEISECYIFMNMIDDSTLAGQLSSGVLRISTSETVKDYPIMIDEYYLMEFFKNNNIETNRASDKPLLESEIFDVKFFLSYLKSF